MVGIHIVDNGAYSIKAESSKKSSPRVVPNCIMKAKSEKRRPFVGDQIEECRDASGLFYILGFQKGYLVNWDVQKTVWDYVFGDLCSKGNFKETSVVITEPYFNFPSIQEAANEIFFEEYECHSLLRINPADLSAFHYLKKEPKASHCLIVDTGYSFTHIIPYIKGKKYKEGIIRVDVGGKLLTNHLKEIISYRQLHVMDETYVINQVKEDSCFVSNNFKLDMATTTKKWPENHIIQDYVLPDFTTIRRGHSLPIDQTSQTDYQKLRLNNERFTVPELLFNPSDIGIKQMGIAEAIVTSVFKSPSYACSYLLKNIVLTGGNAKFPGMQKRVYDDVRSLVPHEYVINVHLPDDPISYAWRGGVHLSRDAGFHSMLVTKEEYDEEGSNICYDRFDV